MTETPVEGRPAGAEVGGDADGAGATGDRRRRLLLFLIPGIVTLLLVGFGISRVVGSEPDSAAPTTTTAKPTTTSALPTTTIADLPVDPWTTVTAQARPDLQWVDVYREPQDAGFAPDPAETRRAENVRAQLPPNGEQNDPKFPPLPRDELPIEGRATSPTGWQFSNPTAFGSPATFLVTERHGDWLRVLMPVRPNGTQGWVRAGDVVLDQPNKLRVSIDVSDRTLRLLDGEQTVLETGIVVGASDSPTPTGRYYVTDRVEKYEGSAYGPWILPVSGYSELMNEFAEGVPVIAMHGTNAPGLIGQARSNGCIRMPNDVITQLKDRLPLGTPVDIWA